MKAVVPTEYEYLLLAYHGTRQQSSALTFSRFFFLPGMRVLRVALQYRPRNGFARHPHNKKQQQTSTTTSKTSTATTTTILGWFCHTMITNNNNILPRHQHHQHPLMRPKLQVMPEAMPFFLVLSHSDDDSNQPTTITILAPPAVAPPAPLHNHMM